MLDARIGHQPLDVVLAHDEQRRDQQGQRTQRHQRDPRQRARRRRVGDRQIAQDAEHRRIEQRARQHRRNRRRALAVRVGQPGMHRRQADLGAVADQHQQKRQDREARMHRRRRLAQRIPGHVVGRAEDKAAIPIEQHRAEQRQADPGRHDDDVFPGGLDAFGGALESDQKGADQGGQLDRDPIERGIVHQRTDQDRQREPGEQRIERREPVVLAEQPHIADRIDRRQQIDDRSAQHDPGAGGVKDDVVGPVMAGSAGAEHRQRHSGGEDDDAGGEVEPGGSTWRPPAEAAEDAAAGASGKDEQQRADHG